jgi:RHS repeat-associated protein
VKRKLILLFAALSLLLAGAAGASSRIDYERQTRVVYAREEIVVAKTRFATSIFVHTIVCTNSQVTERVFFALLGEPARPTEKAPRPYPGRLDRGTLIGSEGGRVPGDGSVTVDIPAGATPEPVRAEVHPIADLTPFGTVNGFTIVSAFEFELSRATQAASADLDGDGNPDPIAPVELLKSASATFVLQTVETRQLVVAEVLGDTAYGTIIQLASVCSVPTAEKRTTTVVREALPLDGIIREGRYLLLAAIDPIAYATGLVRLGSAAGPVVSNAKVSSLLSAAGAQPLGVTDLTRATGVYAVPTAVGNYNLIPRHTTTGDGLAQVASAPNSDAVVSVTLVLAPQPPTLTLVEPTGRSEVSLKTRIVVQSDKALDPSTFGSAPIVVKNAVTGEPVAGTIASYTSATLQITFTPTNDLKPNSRYTVSVSSTIRAINNAPVGQSTTFSFATVTQFVGTGIHPELIRITIPDANGVSIVSGAPGAIDNGWTAIPVRRGRDFTTRYQTQADSTGFRVAIGGCIPNPTAPCADAVSTTDVIDLQLVNTGGILAGIIRLTPFVTADGRGFMAAPELETRFTTDPENGSVTVIVPAGAFDVPTLVTVSKETQAAFAGVPRFDTELAFTNAVRLAFDGTAKKRLQLDFPVPPGTNIATPHLVGLLGKSTRGARVMIVDTLRVAGERFTTLPAGTASQRTAASRTTNASLTPGEVKDSLAGMTQIGVYVNVSIIQPWVFAAIEGLQGNHELFWDTMQSIYASSQYLMENRGRVVIPVLANQPFRVTGVDASTGLESFTKLYDPILPGDPGVAVGIPTPDAPFVGPYPVYGSPFRVESLDLPTEGEDIKTIQNFVVRAANGYVTVTTTLPASTPASVFNVTRGELDASREGGLRVEGKAGDRIVIMSGAADVNPSSTLSVVFSEPISLGSVRTDDGVDAFLRTIFTLEKSASSSSAPLSFVGGNVTPFARFRADSGGRRILVDLPAELEHGATYRLTVSKDVQSASTPLKIGQTFDEQQRPQGGISEGLRFQFSVAAPAGVIGEFDIRQSASASAGRVRDLALNGNVLLIAALEGGLLAYDSSDAAALASTSLPLGYAPPTHGSFWSLATDHHGRIFTATVDETFAALRTYRLEDFAPDGEPKTAEPRLVTVSKSSALLSFAPGANAGTTLSSSSVLTEIPEALPRKIQLAVQDTDRLYESRAAFKTASGASVAATDGGDERLRLAIPMESGFPYNLQRITVENTTRGFTWSADATPTTPARFEYVVAGEGDRLRIILNQRTYGVVTLFGYGLAVYDLNAAESNDAAEKRTGYTLIREKLRLTRGAITSECPFPASAEAIQDLTFSPEAIVLPESTGSANLNVFAVEPRRGIVDLTVPLGSDSGGCDRNGEGLILRGSERSLDHPRLQKLRQAFVAKAGREPLVRFGGGASFHWEITAGANKPIRPARTATVPGGDALGQNADIPPGARGSVSGLAVSRDYMLVPGNEAGLLVVEIGGVPHSSAVTGYKPLGRESLVDVIWIPNGAWAVRMVPGTELAIVVDGLGHLLLVDLSKIDERYDLVGDVLPYDQLFRTAARCLAETRTDGVGAPDPRIVWRSPAPVVATTLAPVVDPDTGLVLGAADKKVKVVAATEPRLRVMADLGEPGLSEVGGIVPLGVDLPADIASRIAALDSARRAKASLAAFRLELTLPGGAAERLPDGKVHIALESERVFGAPATQTAAPLPLAHFRTSAPNGGAESRPGAVMLERAVPASMAPFLRRQRGFNRFVSPWIVAIADPRASEKYTWVYPADATTDDQKRAFERSKGCVQCARPQHLRGANGTLELYSAGRLLATRVDGSSPLGGLKYVGTGSPLVTRVASVPADTVRTPEVLVATQNAPVADGLIDGLVYLHSGELVLATADLDAGGRAGWNVAVDRTYNSRTMLGTDLGLGWDSSLFRRLRALPNGDVEYRDGMGNLHLFKALSTLPGGAAYDAPAGLLLRLARRGDGWTITDQQRRVLTFDAMGRILSASDEFYKGDGIDAGNVVRYLYDERGQLGAIVDPVGRTTRLTYWQDTDTGEGRFAGLLREARDWRERTVLFEYDSTARLTRVRLPEVAVADGVPAKYEHKGAARPTMEYEYTSLPTSYNDVLEFAGNLLRRRMPAEVAAGGPARATYTYDQTGDALKRDRLTGQLFASADTVNVDCKSATEVETTDARGQLRKYALTTPKADALDRGVHVERVTLVGVPVQPALGSSVNPAAPPAPLQDLATFFTYQGQGMVEIVSYPGGLTEKNTWVEPPIFTRGLVLATQDLRGGGDGTIFQRFAYQAAGSTVALAAACRASEACPETYDANSPESAAKFRVASSPNRDVRKVERTDSETGVKAVREYGPHGQLTASRAESSKNGAVASEASVVYWGNDSAGLIERGLPFLVTRGSALRETVSYKVLPGGGQRITTKDMVRGTESVLEFDAWDRAVKRQVLDGTTVVQDERFGYDKNGALAYEMRKQAPLGLVETFYEFDELGRPVETSLTQANVDGTLSTIASKTEYAPGNRTVTTHDPAPEGATATAKTVVEMDGLGRASVQTRVSADGALKESVQFGYDERGLPSYQSDTVRTASQTERDAFGRETRTLRSDGTSVASTWNAWDELTKATENAAPGEGGATSVVARTEWEYSGQGTLLRTFERQHALFRATENFRHDDAVTTEVRSGVAASPGSGFVDQSTLRVVETVSDTAGRVTRSREGGYVGPTGSLDQGLVFAKSTVTEFSGGFPSAAEWSERTAGVSYKTSAEFDALGRPRSALEAGGSYRTGLRYDESGNVLGLTAPGMSEAGATYDSRGLVVTRTRPDGAVARFTYDALGNLKTFTDESGEETGYDTDALGRTTAIRFADGTREEMRYENVTGAVLATRDRAGLWLSYGYDSGGRVESVHLGEDPAKAPIAVRYTYDGGGRVIRIANADAAIEFGDYDELGNPGLTRSVRYSGSTGLDDAPVTSDTHTEGHVWSVFSERTRWRMPAAGSTLPAGTDAAPDASWLTWIDEERDAAGNVRARRKATGATGTAGTLLEDTTWRGSGRPDSRKLFTSTGADRLTSFFQYADGGTDADDVKGPASGLLGKMETQNADAIVIAGSLTLRDEAKRVAGAADLGLKRRGSLWTYDTRGRLATAKLLTLAGDENAVQPVTTETLSAADFRELRDASPGRLTNPQRETLGLVALEVEPARKDFTEIVGHRIERLTESLGTVSAPARTFAWGGGRRTSDGRWSSSYDSFGRVVRVENSDRRIDYTYGPNSRIVGRLAQRANGSAWVTEDRGLVLENDGLPANTTWVWDPITDRLVAIYAAGTSVGTADAQAGLLRQFLHGDAAYDDPVLAKVALIAGATPNTFGPILDHAATGSLQAVVDDDGSLVERVLYADAYGDAPRYLQGAVADQMALEIEKNDEGALTVRVRVRFSDPVVDSRLADGLRLATVTRDGTIAATTIVAPVLEDEKTATILWELSAAEWVRLADRSDAAGLEIAVGEALRFEGWGTTPVAPAPAWTTKVYGLTSETGWPVVKREGLASIRLAIDALGAKKSQTLPLFEVNDLYLFARADSRSKLLTGFHGAPFVEPATGYAFFRARWLDPATGTFITADPQLFVDSSNLYAFCGGDPVNCSDPTGEWGFWDENIDWLDEEGTREFRGFASGSVGALPVFGEATDLLQAATGYDFIAGEQLEPWEQALAAGSVIVPFGGARVLRKATGAGFDAARGTANIVDATEDAQHYLVSQRRIARYEAKVQQLQQSGAGGARLAELSGRVEMLKRGYLREGHGIYEAQTRLIKTKSGKEIRRRIGGKGIDSIYRRFGTEGDVAILESKWRSRFSVGGMVESLLGRGILDPNATGRVYFRQMSHDWIDEVILRLRQSDVPGARRAYELLDGRQYSRFANVLNSKGQAVLRPMP